MPELPWIAILVMFRLFSRKVVRLSTPHRSAAPKITEAAGSNQEAGGVGSDIQQKMEALSKAKMLLDEGKDIKQILTDVFGAKLLSDFEQSMQRAKVRTRRTPDKGVKEQPQDAAELLTKRRD
jgi:hypothetical protein